MEERKSNFELLRIVAMMLIIGSHLALHGVQHVLSASHAGEIYNTGTALNKLVVKFLLPGGGWGSDYFFYYRVIF